MGLNEAGTRQSNWLRVAGCSRNRCLRQRGGSRLPLGRLCSSWNGWVFQDEHSLLSVLDRPGETRVSLPDLLEEATVFEWEKCYYQPVCGNWKLRRIASACLMDESLLPTLGIETVPSTEFLDAIASSCDMPASLRQVTDPTRSRGEVWLAEAMKSLSDTATGWGEHVSDEWG